MIFLFFFFYFIDKFQVLVTQSCLTLCDPLDCSPPGSSVHGILQAKNTGVSSYFPSPGDLPNPGIKPRSPTLKADSLPSESHDSDSPNLLIK